MVTHLIDDTAPLKVKNGASNCQADKEDVGEPKANGAN